jgi:hypothetical protein
MKKEEKESSLIVWVVEDVPEDARQATQVVLAEAREAELRVELYWDQEIRWKSLLSGPPPGKCEPEFGKAGLLPAIVILDLFAPEGFAAEEYFRALRRVEDSLNVSRSWVILWSVDTSFPPAQDLLYVETQRDRKLMFTKSKTSLMLREKLTRCFRSWKEERFK